ncbi:MAG: NADH:ubiquinone reductase (Na(+)-transporting) subunit C [Rikenellaceae bacterium]|jgi:Na+-transporting NADH:ubiquinone oxidoreductase subunit C|nr:NADH:ubiquinone reductase (Na(+)-transporting) subunit C [Rikenellaceae bacterium]
MNTSSNSYTVIYAAVMVVVVAIILSFAALSLKGRQDANVRVEKMGDILGSIGQGQEAEAEKDKNAYIEEQYAKYIVSSYTVNAAGQVTEGTDPFAIALDMKAEYEKPEAERNLPIFEARMDDGATYYIIPVYGSGLWGPIWGNVALEDDFNTIYGVTFGHKGETPGLGAEIAKPVYTDQFKGKQIYVGAELVSIAVTKGAGSSAGNPHAVDAVSGGTITSRGVESMLKTDFAGYEAYFNRMRAQENTPVAQVEPVNETSHE